MSALFTVLLTTSESVNIELDTEEFIVSLSTCTEDDRDDRLTEALIGDALARTCETTTTDLLIVALSMLEDITEESLSADLMIVELNVTLRCCVVFVSVEPLIVALNIIDDDKFDENIAEYSAEEPLTVLLVT